MFIDYGRSCMSDSDCTSRLGLSCSHLTYTCECSIPFLWSTANRRCISCPNNWSFVNSYCMSPLIQTNSSKDAYYKCRAFNAYQINLLDVDDYNTYAEMNIAPNGVYVSRFIFFSNKN